MEATDYLKQIKGINIGIKLKIGEMSWTQRMLDNLIKVWGPYFTRHSSETPAFQNSIVKLSLREQELSEQIDELVLTKAAAESLFDRLENPVYRTILWHRYMEDRSFEDISGQIECGERWTRRLHDKAVAEFERIYDKAS